MERFAEEVIPLVNGGRREKLVAPAGAVVS
jgi:hypothetical protein